MGSIRAIPEKVEDEILLYLVEGEKILRAVSSASGLVGKIGELWLILTDKNLVFHTREHDKESVVALMARAQIGQIIFYQHSQGITLTFIPAGTPRNQSRVSFPISQKQEVETFCEELADLITFQSETQQGLKFISQPSPQQTGDKPAIGNKANDAEQNKLRPINEEKSDLVKPAAQPLNPLKMKLSPQPPSESIPAPDISPSEIRIVENSFVPSPGFVFAATMISVCVAILWFLLATSIGNRD